ncbi:MAG: pyrroline-5-carboxylate reductase [Planctomycetes bacterium RBG_13_62_9]|nr:MAG: pyrroline-5-carboxylate reductase [Planctomycetes bacterium RBG_13_62_9]
MAEALINGVLKAGVYRPGKVYVSDVRAERVEYLREHYGVRTAADNADLASRVDVLVLSVKPQNMKDALNSIKGCLSEDILVISIAAGIKTTLISSILGDLAIVRVMPNMPAWVDEAASVLYANEKARTKVEKARLILLSVGKVAVVDDEGLLDAVTAVSGSGPAYFFLLMQEMITAGIALGLPEEEAQNLVLQTAKGAALLAEKAAGEGSTPAQLSARVATPNGTTEAAFKIFQARGFSDMVSTALHRAAERSRELSAG